MKMRSETEETKFFSQKEADSCDSAPNISMQWDSGYCSSSGTADEFGLRQFVSKLKEASSAGDRLGLKKLAELSSAQLIEEKDALGQTALMFSIAFNQLDCASSLIKAGARVDSTDNSGQTALHIAVSKGFHQCVRFLLAHGAKWQQQDTEGVTALHAAAIHPSPKSLILILKELAPGEVDIQDGLKKTALHWSAAYANVEHMQLLLGQGANVCIPDSEGKTPLHWAATSRDPKAVDCMRILLEKEPSVINWQDYEGRSALHLAVSSGSTQAVAFLTAREHCSINILDNMFSTPLHWASRQGLSDKISLLLDRGADYKSADGNGATALHYAAHYNHVDALKVLLTRNYVTDEPDNKGCTAVIWAAARKADDALLALAKFKVELNHADRNGCTALHAAALNGHVETTELLLSLKASADIRDKAGMTPFLRACEMGRAKVAEVFLQYGSCIAARDKCKRMGIHWAAKGGFAYLCQILLHYGSPVNVQDMFGLTPLHYTTVGCYENCVSVILDAKADPDVADREGKTALHWAVAKHNLEIVKLLYEYGAFVNAMALIEKWVTPLDCALQLGHGDLVQFLRNRGGLTSQEIEFYAARKIQNWFRRVIHRKFRPWCPRNGPISRRCKNCVMQRHHFQNKIPFNTHGCKHFYISEEDKSAFVIQKAWQKFLVKKKMCHMRQKIAEAFPTSERRKAAEKDWEQSLTAFLNELQECIS